MDVLTTLVLVICLLGVALSVVMLVQANRVYRARIGLLDQISQAAQNDIYDGRDWRWRYAEYDTVSYSEMMRRPWRSPLDCYHRLDFAAIEGEQAVQP